MKPLSIATLPLAAALVFSAAPIARAQSEDEAVVDAYAAGDYGRVRVAENGAVVLRFQDDDGHRDDRLGTNSPVFPGDQVRTGRDQRLEIELAGGSLVRIDRDAEVTFQALPDPYAEHPDNTILTIDYGAMQIAARLASKEEFRVDTPAASVYLVGDGDFRIDVDEDGNTIVSSRRGVAEVVGNDASVLVRAGLLTEVARGDDPETPRRFNVYTADAFDRWSSDRDRLARQWRGDDEDLDADDLPYTVRPYYRELSAHGHWAYDPTYGNVWYPSSVAVGWRPYYDGYWYHSPSGYFWVSNEPWGWAPYHYGRWVYANRYGWAWCPGRIFGGAWVSWSWGSVYIGWAPLDFWDRPVFYHTVIYDYYDPWCWSFVRYDHLVVRDYRRFYVPADRIGSDLHRHAVVTRPPRVAPQALIRDAALRDRTWRSLQQDRVARVAPVRRDATPRHRFADAENRAVQRGVLRRAASPRAGAADVRRPVAPEARGPARSAERIERPGKGPQRTDEGPRARPAAPREPATRTERPAPHPRRITSPEEIAPRSAERPRPKGDAVPRDAARDDRPDTDRRVRDFYRDAGRPVEPRRPESADRGRDDDRGRAPEARPSERPRPPERAEPRSEPRSEPRPERQAPRAEPRSEPRPERQAPRAEPRRDNDRGRAAPKKDDGGGSKRKKDDGGSRGRGRGR